MAATVNWRQDAPSSPTSNLTKRRRSRSSSGYLVSDANWRKRGRVLSRGTISPYPRFIGLVLVNFINGILYMASDAIFVLVVEDEGLIRMSLVEDLEDAGFKVFEAATADEALRVLDDHPEIEALFTDIDMPGSMDGLKLAQVVHHSRPAVAILLTSGYLKVPKNDLPDKIPFLSKPYEVDRVVNHIRELIAA